MISRRSLARWLAIGASGVGAFLACISQLRDPDTFHHLAMGREIMRGGFPSIEPFLFPFAGAPAGAPVHWLGSVLVYLSQGLLGDAGPVLLPATVVAVLFGVLLADAIEAEELTAAGLATRGAALAVALAVIRPRAVARPEIFADLLLATCLLALRSRARGRGDRILFALPLLFALWANIHPSALLGLAVLSLWLGVDVVRAVLARALAGRAPGSLRPAPLGPLALAAVGSVIAAVLTPDGAGPLRLAAGFASGLLGVRTAAPAPPVADHVMMLLKHRVSELQPMVLADWLGPFGLLLGASVIGMALDRRRARLHDLLVIALLGGVAASARRFTVYAAVAAAPVAARHLGAASDALVARLRPALGRIALAVAALALVAAGAWAARPAVAPYGLGVAPASFPVRAADYLAALGFRGRLFDTFQFGGYLEWRLGVPVFQDGRALLRPGDEDAAIEGPGNYRVFEPLDARYRFDALVVQYPTPSSNEAARVLLGAVPGQDWCADRRTWALVAFDDGGLLYLRRDGAHAAAAARDEFRVALPCNPMSGDDLVEPRASWLREDLARSVMAVPSCRLCRVQLGIAEVGAGRLDDGERALWPAVGEPDDISRYALAALARAAEQRGDLSAAFARYERAIEAGLTDPETRTAAAEIALRAGSPDRAEAVLGPALAGDATPDALEVAARAAAARGDAPRASELARRADAARSRARAAELAREAASLAIAGDRAGAIRAYRASLASYDEDAAAHAGLAGTLVESGLPGSAEADARRAIALDPNLPDGYLHLARVLAARGDAAGAAAQLRQFLRLEPRGARAMSAEEQLQRLLPPR